MAKRAYDKNYIAPTKKLGPGKKELARQKSKPISTSTPPPAGLPEGTKGRVEHMRGHSLWYFYNEDPKSQQGHFLWRIADVLERDYT